MKKRIFILCFIILPTYIFCDQLSNYTIEKIHSISTETKEGLIGWEPSVAGGYSGPTAIAIRKNKIYIPDSVNYRINIYNDNFEYMETIKELKKESHFAHFIKVDENENIIALIVSHGLKKINQKGEKIFLGKQKNHRM